MLSIISDASFIIDLKLAGCACLVQLGPGEKRIMITSVQKCESSVAAELYAGALGVWYLHNNSPKSGAAWYVDNNSLHQHQTLAGWSVEPRAVLSSGVKRLHHKCHRESRSALTSLGLFDVQVKGDSIVRSNLNLADYVT